MASRTSNHQNQSQDPYNQKHKSSDQMINRHHHQRQRRQQRTSTESSNLQTTNVNTTRAATTRVTTSSQFYSVSNKAVHGSTSSGHHQQLSSTRQVSRTQFQTKSTSTSTLSRFDGLSTTAVCDHGSRPRISSLNRLQQQDHSKKAVHGSRSGNNIKPQVQLQQHHGTSQSSRFDVSHSTKAVHVSKSGNNIKPPPVRLQQHHGKSQLNLSVDVSTRAVHGSTSFSVRLSSNVK
ncbi:hypothetical protein Ddye_028175 [Dipteronia dyeriana]|uniref:Uncharacterized protein n=1 Tax=Dipteronia dyeriana TaxID=168575 RepID=A0AAD9WS46_9ROSI|nr:hypothetical protein Ddye_028175 [Dipteronia dyeriana]